jgi:hypothetical protein
VAARRRKAGEGGVTAGGARVPLVRPRERHERIKRKKNYVSTVTGNNIKLELDRSRVSTVNGGVKWRLISGVCGTFLGPYMV